MKNLIFSMIICFFIFRPSIIFADDYTMSYLYGGTTTTYINYIERTKGVLDTICPSYFDINDNGDLKINGVDKIFIKNMHNRGIRVVPMISNHWDREKGNSALENREKLSKQIKETVIKYNLDGVNVDIENVTHEYKDKYTDFVRRLKQELPEKEVSVAVAANPNEFNNGWQGSYDYKKLSKYSDYIVIMAYDESYHGSEQGPVASSSFVEKSIKYALKNTTPDKVVLAIPFYGRYWKKDSPVGGYGITWIDIKNLSENYASTEKYYSQYNSVKTVITINDKDIKPQLWGGRILDSGVYEIWHDNLETLKYKINLAKKYNLKGTSSWALGQEDASIWDYYAEIKKPSSSSDKEEEQENNKPLKTSYNDTKEHWASYYIEAVTEKGWMRGVSNKLFKPEKSMTRAEAVAVIAKVMLDYPYNGQVIEFDDTKGHWAEKYINKARYYGIVSGTSDNNFEPDRQITREEFCLLIDKVFDIPNTVNCNNNHFNDFNRYNNSWSYNSVIKLYENEIIKGYPDSSFKPYNGIKRSEAAVVFEKLSGFGINNLVPASDKFNTIPDDDIIEPR